MKLTNHEGLSPQCGERCFDAAISKLVRRYVELVHSTAFGWAGDCGMVVEFAKSWLLRLVRKAGTIRISPRFPRYFLIVALGLIPFGLNAQNFQALYTFTATSSYGVGFNGDGAWPLSRLLLSNNVLYGGTSCGGTGGFGTVFSIRTDGTGFTNLGNFNYAVTNSSGVYWKSGLVLISNKVYGLTQTGGSLGYGTLFSVNTNGTGLTTVHEFQGLSDGACPDSPLLLSSNLLYGETALGGSQLYGGTVFAMRPDATGIKLLESFPTNADANTEGNIPGGGLALSASGTTLYGAASIPFTRFTVNVPGSVFAVNTDGTGFRTVHTFAFPQWVDGVEVYGDGYQPSGGVVLSTTANTLYGTTQYGGNANFGVAYSVNTDGSNYKVLHSFNTNEGFPIPGVVLSASGNILYGSTYWGGASTVYALKTDGSAFLVLHQFSMFTTNALGPVNADGFWPNALILSGSTLYGTTQGAGLTDSGTIFSIGLGLSSTVAATPPIVHLGDTITVAVTALNSADDNINTVQLLGPIAVAGDGGVSPQGPSGPTTTSVLAPLTTTTFNNLFLATNYGTVTFTAAVTGTGQDGPVTSALTTSPGVSIVPRGDLLLKRVSDPAYAGAGIYQKVPILPQVETNAVETNEVSTFSVEVVNSDSNSVDFTLVAKADNATWSTRYYQGAQDVTAQITNGMTLPTLAPGASLAFTVSTTPTNFSTNGIVFSLGWAANPTLTLDAVQAVSAGCPIPLTLILHRLQYNGFTPASLQAGLTDITAPLQPVSDPQILSAQPVITQGLVADDVTPLLVEVAATASHLAAYPNGRTFNASSFICANGTLTGDAPLLAQVFDPATGAWSSTGTNFTLSPNHTNAFLLVGPVASDNVQLTGSGLATVAQINDQTTGGQAGWQFFTIRKPPIFLVHGYASPGFWDPAFMQIFSSTRPMTMELDPDNFVVTIRYGQGGVPFWFTNQMAVYENTVKSLADCAVDLNAELADAKSNILQNWAMTRYDVVAHSQGGVLSRMLSSQVPNGKISATFRNPDNFFRGRFHRVVTIGSPHNGSRLLHFLLALSEDAGTNHFYNYPSGAILSSVAVYAQVAQKKFDPFGEEIKDLNNPSLFGNWRPDPAAQFHLVRPVIDGGSSPAMGDTNLGYILFNLIFTNGGQAVIPRGSDGVVDYDSMAANGTNTPAAPNVYNMPTNLAICHAEPKYFFGATVSETASTDIARHVINTLDQNGLEPSNNTQFGSFPQPPLLGDDVRQGIDAFASKLFQITIKQAIQMSQTSNGQPHPLDGNSSTYQFHLNFPGDNPPGGTVTWFALVYGTNGVTSAGVTCIPSGGFNSNVTVTVTGGLIGDVVLFAFYPNTAQQMVQASGQLVVSQGPTGATLTGIGVLPWNPTLPMGTVIPIQVVALYSDGTSCVRYVTDGSLAATSSNPSVVSVTDPSSWQLLSPGNARVVVSWSGFNASNQLSVFQSTSELPQLSIAPGGGCLVLDWPLWASDFTLMSSATLLAPNWQPVGIAATTNGAQLNLTLPAPKSPAFFRLQR